MKAKHFDYRPPCKDDSFSIFAALNFKTLKKLLIGASLCLALGSTYAQRNSTGSSDDSSLKPSGKAWLTELNVNPFKGELSLNNSLNQIKIRRFLNESTALRLGLTAESISSKDEQINPYGTTPTTFKQKRSSTTLGLNLGFERHLKGTRRLSPFIGADIAFANRSSEQETTNNQLVTTIKGAWSTVTLVPVFLPGGGTTYQQITQPDQLAYTQIGLNLVSGFDFYISRSFFFGYEFNFGFTNTQYKDAEYTQKGGNTPPPTNNSIDQDKSSFSFGPKLFNGIRLGYAF
jgi:hypothetical protein